jgi:hypothetical protein
VDEGRERSERLMRYEGSNALAFVIDLRPAIRCGW